MIEQRGIRRFAPTRAGIINLWDYRDEEFSFVDGWLVLRGPNGSGKTKALEVLFPFVLDGRIEPRRLNPFASEDRTMKSNLLYRGQEVTHAYVWMEFGDGTHYVTVGIGLRAHRHVDRVTRWHFVVDGRVGVDFSLLDFDDRPLTRRDLIDRLGADAVRDSAEDYRQLIDARLFGLGPARYEQLLDLVLTLRKPQLAKDLNPVELSRTLQRGLRPVEDHLLVEAARSFDDMEAVARTLEGLVAADGATAAFLTVYSTYLRTHARVAADALTARRDAVATRSTALGDARASAEAAAEAESTADERLRAVEGEPGRLRAHLDSLKASTAYQSHEQLADLQRHVHDLAEAAGRADEAVAAEESMAARRRTESERATVAALLDAWLHPDPGTAATALAGDDLDAYLLPLPPHRRPTGATLADVLTPEEQDDVPAARITEVLTSVALADVTTPAAAPVTIGVDGRYAQGISAGRFAKVSCEYIGATARAARRADRATAPRPGPGRVAAVDRLDDTAEAVSRFERGGVRLEGARTAAARAAEQEDQARQRHDEAVDRLTAATETARTARARHQEKAEAYRTLRDSVGADAERVLADVARTADAITEAEQAVEQARTALGAARERRVAALTRVELGEQALVVAVAEAQHDAQRLRPYAQPDLLSLLRCPTDLRWPAQTSDDELHPQVAALHEAILTATRELSPTETSLKQSATRLTSALTDLQAQLPAAGLDHRPEWDTDDGVIVVRVADEQGLTPVAHFADRITRERRDQEQLLTDSEQRVLEDALLGQLARQIHHRTIEARDLVAAMDSQMRARRMSSGLTVGVGWRLADDLDTEQRDVCKLLERDPARLGPGQLTTMRRHFAARIKTARAAAPERPYRELLGDVLDYRQWRTFAFTLHRPGGGTEALTRARHSQLSGGEQSVSLHLPLFAAANALFGSARPDAPRLLGLDEAFAGVDDTGRGELMALAKQFDLDLFMTGYDLWATHPAVSGAAHYDLSHSAVEHAVSTVLLVWDGSTNIADFDGTLARALGSPETRRAPAGHSEADRTGVLLDLTDE